MIECRGRPRNRIVASRAIAHPERGPCRWVRGIIRLLPRSQMAAGVSAIRWCNLQVVVVADVARGAGHSRVRVGQRKVGGRECVVERRPQPAVKRMARLAGRRELRADVIRIRRLLKIRQVASRAVR